MKYVRFLHFTISAKSSESVVFGCLEYRRNVGIVTHPFPTTQPFPPFLLPLFLPSLNHKLSISISSHLPSTLPLPLQKAFKQTNVQQKMSSTTSHSPTPHIPHNAPHPHPRPRGKTALQCPFCARRFFKTDHLRRHERSHTKERPFCCVVCGRGFGRQ